MTGFATGAAGEPVPIRAVTSISAPRGQPSAAAAALLLALGGAAGCIGRGILPG